MQKCPKCLAEQDNLNSSACFYCGTDMSQANDVDSSKSDIFSKDDEHIPEKNITLPDTDDLGIETNADIMDSGACDLSDTEPIEEETGFEKEISLESYQAGNENSISN